MLWTGYVSRVGVTLIAAGCVAACGGSDDSGGAAGSGGSPAGDCGGECSVLMSTHCFYAGGENDCATSCNGWEAQANSGSDPCKQAWADYKSCMVTASISDCGGVPTWNVLPCRAQYDHFWNYCYNGVTPDTPCIDNAAFNAYCADVPGKPAGKVCQGSVPVDCAVGGTSTNADLYCCP